MSTTILIAPSGFKESLDAKSVALAIERGILRADPDIDTIRLPMADGGEGFVEAMCEATGGSIRHCAVTGPVGTPVGSHFGYMGGAERRTAVIEMAAAAGLRLVPRDRRNPMLTTSRGVGELIRLALDGGCSRILIGCGDSGVNDGGAGMAQALGVRLLDRNGQEIGAGGGELARLARIDASGLDRRIRHVQLDAAVNWHNMLLGERGVARIFGPQKGATPDQVRILEDALETLAHRMEADLGVSVRNLSGGGASGGLGAGLAAFLGARLHPRYEIVLKYVHFDDMLKHADLVFTAEGGLDGQTPFGKVPCEVGRRAKARGIPVIALAGTIGKGARATMEHGIDAYASIIRKPCSLEQAMASTEKLIERAAESAVRMIDVGRRMRRTTHIRRVRDTNSAVATASPF